MLNLYSRVAKSMAHLSLWWVILDTPFRSTAGANRQAPAGSRGGQVFNLGWEPEGGGRPKFGGAIRETPLYVTRGLVTV